MRIKAIVLFLFVCLLACFQVCKASNQANTESRHPLYVGLLGGYGSTTWGALVPQSPSVAMSLSVPLRVSEGGAVWGFFGGYEFIREFALEATYIRYPTARLLFDEVNSLFTFNNGFSVLTTRAESLSVMAKFMLPIGQSKWRAYSSAGVAEVHRYDTIKNIWRTSPAFGVGLNYEITEHWMAEIASSYIAGYGQAEIDPTKSFVPFLYSLYLGLAYRV